MLIGVDYTYHAPSVWDWVVLIALEVQCGVFLILTTFWLPISDWLMRRWLRKETEYRHKLSKRKASRHVRRYEPVGRSKWWGRNRCEHP